MYFTLNPFLNFDRLNLWFAFFRFWSRQIERFIYFLILFSTLFLILMLIPGYHRYNMYISSVQVQKRDYMYSYFPLQRLIYCHTGMPDKVDLNGTSLNPNINAVKESIYGAASGGGLRVDRSRELRARLRIRRGRQSRQSRHDPPWASAAILQHVPLPLVTHPHRLSFFCCLLVLCSTSHSLVQFEFTCAHTLFSTFLELSIQVFFILLDILISGKTNSVLHFRVARIQ